jgi:ribosome-associated protein
MVKEHSLIDTKMIENELRITTSRSGGPGGQHANKVETRVQVAYDVTHSNLLSEEQKTTIIARLKNKLSKDGILIITSDKTRSQSKNKELAIKKLINHLNKALKKDKIRKKTQPTTAAIVKRLKEKKIQSEKKKMRKGPEI